MHWESNRHLVESPKHLMASTDGQQIVPINIGVFEVAVATLFAALISVVLGYLNYRSSEYASLEDKQRQLTQTLDNRTFTYTYSGNPTVHENWREYLDKLEMNVKTPTIYDRSISQDRKDKELKEKFLPGHQNTRYTSVQAEFHAEPDRFPDLYDLCVFNDYTPAAYRGGFTSIRPNAPNSKISVINMVAVKHFEFEIVSDRVTDVIRALESFYGAVITAIVYRELLNDGELHYQIQRSLASSLREEIGEFEQLNEREHPLFTGPAIAEEVLEEFRNRLNVLEES